MKAQPLSLRLPPEDIGLIDRAAKIRGRSRTEFMREASLREAEAALSERAMIRMTEAGFANFAAALEETPVVNEKLLNVLRRSSRWDKLAGND